MIPSRSALVLLALLTACNAYLGDDRCDPACAPGERCLDGACVPGGSCQKDGDCQDDSYCLDGTCVAYGERPRGPTNASCNRLVPAGLLLPQIFCEWSGPAAGDPFPGHREVLSTPLVADFNLDGHGGGEFPTLRPSIVINTYDGTDGSCGLGPMGDGQNFGVIRVLDGRTCQQQLVIPTHVNGATTPALGDLDGDGRPEIVALSATGGVVAFRWDGQAFQVLWTSRDPAGAAHDPLAGLCEWTGPSIADLDDDGRPEVLAEGYVYDAAGRLVDGALGPLAMPFGVGQFPVVADVDRDGAPEAIAPRFLQRWNKAQKKWVLLKSFPSSTGTGDFVAVADFGKVSGAAVDRATLDGVAEVAVISGGTASLLSLDGAVVFGPVSLPGSKGGGPPTVGDFDNDGRPEFAAAGSDSYTVFDPDCAPGGDARHCPSGRRDGILWSSVSQDHSSNITGSSVFDFEGDGTAEAVYADECYARIYSGTSGEVLFSQPHSSCTWAEYPVVADVQGNFRSKLIVPSNRNCTVTCPPLDPAFKGLRCMSAADCPSGLPCDAGLCRCGRDAECNTESGGGGFVCRPAPMGVPGAGSTCQASFSGTRSGIRVFGDVLDRWASSRPLWSEHAYSITNINDDGTIPKTSAVRRNWEQPGLNNFRMNLQGAPGPQPAPDLTSRAAGSATCDGGRVTLTAALCNRGAAPVGDGVAVSFYEGTTLLCTARTTAVLRQAMCATVTCSYDGPGGAHSVTVVADDDGTGKGQSSECEEGNNRATLRFDCG